MIYEHDLRTTRVGRMRSDEDVTGVGIAVNLVRKKKERESQVASNKAVREIEAHPSPVEDLTSKAIQNGIHRSLEREVPALKLRFIVDLAADETKREGSRRKGRWSVSV